MTETERRALETAARARAPIDARCYYYLHTYGVPPIRCDAGIDGHASAHHYPRSLTVPRLRTSADCPDWCSRHRAHSHGPAGSPDWYNVPARP
jgi:hypothetical protein